MVRKGHLLLIPAIVELVACGDGQSSHQESAASTSARQQALANSARANQISQQAMATANEATTAANRMPQPRSR
jgi:hypothetical protein